MDAEKLNMVETAEYREALEKFNAVTDRPVALTLLGDRQKPLKERLQVLEIDEAQKRQEERTLSILIMCFNEVVMVEIPQP